MSQYHINTYNEAYLEAWTEAATQCKCMSCMRLVGAARLSMARVLKLQEHPRKDTLYLQELARSRGYVDAVLSALGH